MKIIQLAREHLPAVLTGTGIAMDVAFGVAMGDACVKASRVVEARTQEYGRRLSKEEKVKETWQFFVLPGLLFIGGASCHVGANVASYKKQVAIMGVATGAETAYTKLKEQLPEVAGKGKAKKAIEKTEQAMAQNALPEDESVIETCSGMPQYGPRSVLMWERWTGRWFWSNTEELKHTENVLNELRGTGDAVEYNEFLMELGLKPSKSGELWHWQKQFQNDLLSVEWTYGDGTFTMADGTEVPYLIVRFNQDPTIKYIE